jgi:hypothetical protein
LPPETDLDRLPNEIMVTGGVFMALSQWPESRVEIPLDENGEPSNSVWLWVPWMKSRYRVTVTMDPEEKWSEGLGGVDAPQ